VYGFFGDMEAGGKNGSALFAERLTLQKNASLTLPAMIGQYEDKEELRTKKGCRENRTPPRQGRGRRKAAVARASC